MKRVCAVALIGGLLMAGLAACGIKGDPEPFEAEVRELDDNPLP